MIKKINEKMPGWMKRPFAKTIRKKLIRNHAFIEMYELLVKADYMTLEEKKTIQTENLKKVLQHAYEHTEYYHALFDKYDFNPYKIMCVEDLKKLPVLTKETLINNLDKIAADDIEDVYSVATGGTTGKPVKVFMEKNAIYRE